MNKRDGLSAEEARGRMIRRMVRCDESSACESENEETARARMIIRMLRTDADGDDEAEGAGGGNAPEKGHGNTHIPYGLCKKFGIELPDGATPEEAWEALKGEGISVDKTYNTLQKKGTIRHIKPKNSKLKDNRAGKSGRAYHSADKSIQPPEPYKKSTGLTNEKRAEFKNVTAGEFALKIKEAIASINPRDAWRVTAYSKKEYKKHANAKFFCTKGGSTVAVTEDGDIISVCRHNNDRMHHTINGHDLLAMAVENGGIKLDSYAGNHKFYLECGFEPVSWCKFDPKYAPDGWDPRKGDEEEAVIFYKYTGNKYAGDKDPKSLVKKFINEVPACANYEEAQKIRDREV